MTTKQHAEDLSPDAERILGELGIQINEVYAGYVWLGDEQGGPYCPVRIQDVEAACEAVADETQFPAWPEDGLTAQAVRFAAWHDACPMCGEKYQDYRTMDGPEIHDALASDLTEDELWDPTAQTLDAVLDVLIEAAQGFREQDRIPLLPEEEEHIRDTMRDYLSVPLSDLTDEVRTYERTLAPGSETLLLGKYCEAMRRLTGHLPEDDIDEDIRIPRWEAEWWRGAYRIAEWAEEDVDRWDRHYGDGADDYWQWTLNVCPDPATWTPPPLWPSDLRVWREGEGLTQARAAELAGVTLRTWQRWEAGDTPTPHWLPDRLRQQWGNAP